MIYSVFSLQLKRTGVELVVGAVLSHEFVVGAAFDDLAVVEDHDDVGVLDGRESVGDDEDGASFHERIHAALDEGLRCVYRWTRWLRRGSSLVDC